MHLPNQDTLQGPKGVCMYTLPHEQQGANSSVTAQLAHYCFNTLKMVAFQAMEFDGNYQIQQ